MTTAQQTARVLVVEDDRELAGVFAEFLTELGYRVAHVATAEQALGTLAGERPDIILLDLRLPGMSGLDFLRLDALREAGIPVAVMSGVATRDEAQAALSLGAVDFLAKPVTLERLAGLMSYLEGLTLRGRGGVRHAPRATVMFPVRVGGEWEWRAMDLSPFGVKVAPQGWPRTDARLRLVLAVPDGDPPLEVEATLVRRDPDGDVFAFLNIGRAQFQRISRFVKSRAQHAR